MVSPVNLKSAGKTLTDTSNNTRVILVVEDEPLIRMDAVDTIEDAGFQTAEAGSAAAALKVLEARDDISIVFTDVEMPGEMDGLGLAAHIRLHWPAIAIVIASGFVKSDDVTLPDGAVVIAKPYGIGQVTQTLQKLSSKQT